MNLDFTIINGTIIDGESNTPYKSNISIKGDKIEYIGKEKLSAQKTIDANNLLITPGFIDIHTHSDLVYKNNFNFQNTYDIPIECKNNNNFLYQGVTTIVTGNCGLGFADTHFWMNFALKAQIPVNIFHLIPYGSVRKSILKENQTKDIDSISLNKIKNRIEEEMNKGALGFSTGLEYAPGCFTSEKELLEVAKIVKKFNGVYATHLRSETGYSSSGSNIIAALKEAINISEKTNISLEISHLKLGKPFGSTKVNQILDKIEKSRSHGMKINADQYPYEAGSTMITYLLPDKFKSTNGLKQCFRLKTHKSMLKKYIKNIFSIYDPREILLSSCPSNKKIEGLTLYEVAQNENISIVDLYYDLICYEDVPWAVFFFSNPVDVDKIASKDFIITISDGWSTSKDLEKPHPRLYGSFPRKIKKYVFEKELLSLTAAIKSMTSLPAKKFNIKKRGILKVGNYADLNISDINNFEDCATYSNPHQLSKGIDTVFINGKIELSTRKPF